MILTGITVLLAVMGTIFTSRRASNESESYRFGSFAPVRYSSKAKWLVDGKDYMSAVADAMNAAREEIFITDWQLNPHIFMKRPDNGINSQYWRLDKLLLRKAEEGIHVYILLYWESKKIAGMDLGSEYASSVLNHNNIEVRRHPHFSTLVTDPATMRWSHHEKIVVVDRSIAFVGGIDLCFGRWDTHKHELSDYYPLHPSLQETGHHAERESQSSEKFSRWIGKDYGNTFMSGARTNLDKPFEDYVDRSKDPRMPWHDVACMFDGPPALDVAKHFIQRYNAIYPDAHKLTIEDQARFVHTFPDPSNSNLKIQVLRSVDSWSAGQPCEASIYNAYLDAIEKAEHFIYIENQFFISSQRGVFRKVENKILVALADRIYRAYENSEDFHVMLMMPLKPEFPEGWDTETGNDLRAVSYWTYATIYSGEDSLFSRLKHRNIPTRVVSQYFSVYGLRTHGSLNGKPVTEIIYVHSKLMIVDDRITIIGSANINDRSMLGARDSEVAVMIEDVNLIDGTMNNQPYQVGKFAHSLRCHLLKEHLGVLNDHLEIDVEDPLRYSFRNGISDQAIKNTRYYETVFRGRILPTNHVWNFEDLKNWQSIEGTADVFPEEAGEDLSKVRGHIVIFPALFLRNELKPSFLDYVNMYVDRRGQTTDLNFDEGKTIFA